MGLRGGGDFVLPGSLGSCFAEASCWINVKIEPQAKRQLILLLGKEFLIAYESLLESRGLFLLCNVGAVGCLKMNVIASRKNTTG